MAETRASALLPGVLLLAAVGGLGWLVGVALDLPGLVVAVGLGALVGNAVDYPDRFAPGVGTHKLWLETGIVLLGAGVALDAVVRAGPTVVLLVVATAGATLLFVELLAGGLLSVPRKLTSLLAAGASICGVSAVVSVAGSIDADESHVAYASAAVLAFDAVTLVAYPAVGHLLSLSDVAFGVWAGTTMFSTGPVTAAGFAYSPTAGRWAVLVKLVRNAFVGVVAVGYAMYYASGSGPNAGRELRDEGEAVRAERDGDPTARDDAGLAAAVSDAPRFLVGFLLLMVLGNTVLTPAAVDSLTTLSTALFLLAFAGLGLELRVRDLRRAGATPLAVLAASLVTFSGLMLLVVVTLF